MDELDKLYEMFDELDKLHAELDELHKLNYKFVKFDKFGKCCDEFDFYFLALFCLCKY